MIIIITIIYLKTHIYYAFVFFVIIEYIRFNMNMYVAYMLLTPMSLRAISYSLFLCNAV
jgi:hypothetical protein